MNEVVKSEEQELTPAIIKKYICPAANEQEIYMFLQLCRQQGLNPFLREAYLIKYGDEKASMVVGKETFTKRADRLPDCDGMEAGIIVLDNAKNVTYRNGAFIVVGEQLLGGWANVYRKGRTHPYRIEVSLSEYERRNKRGELTKAWREMPATMLRKVALVQALREAYPQEFANMLSPEEMPIDTLPEYRYGQEIPPPVIPMPQRKSEQSEQAKDATAQDDNPFAGKDSDGLTIKDVAVKTGKDAKGKRWIKYHITSSDGVTYTTFSKTLNESAVEAMRSGSTVVMDAEESQYGQELKSLSVVECEPAKTAEGWTIDKIINIITSSDDIGVLDANWKSLMPHISKLDAAGKAKCQALYDETKKFIGETVKT